MSSEEIINNEEHPLLKVVFIQRVVRYISPHELSKPLELRTVCTAWSETVQEFFGAAHVWQNILARQGLHDTVSLYRLMIKATINGSAWIVNALVRAGISPNVGNPIANAAREGHSQIVRMMLDFSTQELHDSNGYPHAKLELNLPDRGFTALQWSVIYKDMKQVKMICDHVKENKDKPGFSFDTEIRSRFATDPYFTAAKGAPHYPNMTALGIAYRLDLQDDDEDEDDEGDTDGDNNVGGEEGEKSFDSRTKKQKIIEMLLEIGAKPENTGTSAPPALPPKTQQQQQQKPKQPIKSSAVKCTKCKFAFPRYNSCASCRAPYCLVCGEHALQYSIKLSKNLCSSCLQGEIEKYQKQQEEKYRAGLKV